MSALVRVESIGNTGIAVCRHRTVLRFGKNGYNERMEEDGMKTVMKSRIFGGLFGHAAGDALGVPAEFLDRGELKADPVTDMIGWGTHYQPPGTWSDDTSLTLCLAASLMEKGCDLTDQAERFVRWRREGYMTPHGEVFDIGNATSVAVDRIEKGIPPAEAGGRGERDNGNGGLMRILPAALYFAFLPEDRLAGQVRDIVSVTHGHWISTAACVLYILTARNLFWGFSREQALRYASAAAERLFRDGGSAYSGAAELFEGILSGRFLSLPEDEIRSGGYVADTLSASLWCLFTTESYRECVLKAVSLGSDTDTTAAVAGGLAGIYYGYEGLPPEWAGILAEHDMIYSVMEQFAEACLDRAVFPVPFPGSYWIIPGRLLAGEYPGSRDPVRKGEKVQKLPGAGVNCIIDLTEEGELEPYHTVLKSFCADCRIVRMSVTDYSVPTKELMAEILDTVDDNLLSGRTVYFHCWGGHGRTGTAAGCWLKRCGIAAGETVFSYIRGLRPETDDADIESPETEEQKEFVRAWREGL
jgi:ADP-ribosyl-[dinitrogen reductase] hydrolase